MRALVAAVPSGARREERRALPRGELPDAASIPRGCRFHPRCPERFEPCDVQDPPQFAAAGAEDHRAACLLLSQPPAARP